MAGTASATSNIETVADIFACFGKGDVPAILAKLTDDVEWRHGGNPDIIPYAKPYFGKAGATEFFQTLGSSIAVKSLVPANFRMVGNDVHHEFHVEADVPATGKSFVADAEVVWGFDQNGKVCSYVSSGDYTSLEEAFRS